MAQQVRIQYFLAVERDARLIISSLPPPHSKLSSFTESGMDYRPLIAERFPLDVFLAGTSTRRDCFFLNILDDDTAEDDEFLFLDLSLLGRQDNIRITLNSTRVTILDNE